MAGSGLMGGLFGLAILAIAGVALIKIVGDAFQCSVCGYQDPNRQAVVSHLRTVHPEEVARARPRTPSSPMPYNAPRMPAYQFPRINFSNDPTWRLLTTGKKNT
jgi:hypothetical protein